MAALWLGQDSRFASMLHRLDLADVLHDGSEKGRIVFLLGGFEVGRNVCAVRQVLCNVVLTELLLWNAIQITFLIHQIFHPILWVFLWANVWVAWVVCGLSCGSFCGLVTCHLFFNPFCRSSVGLP